jgi:hypothetical protein
MIYQQNLKIYMCFSKITDNAILTRSSEHDSCRFINKYMPLYDTINLPGYASASKVSLVAIK